MITPLLPPGLLFAVVLCLGVSCAGSDRPKPVSAARAGSTGKAFFHTINLQEYLIPKGHNGRYSGRGMKPRYITIHSTANPEASAWNHARALRNGKLRSRTGGLNRTGYLTWHFTVDHSHAFQHLPVDEQGEHADYSGPGNRKSIGVEICEFHSSRAQAAAVDRAARLTSWLIRENKIPLERVVPHYHWPRWPNNWHKPCPRIFMTNGRPGPRWDAFLERVDYYYRHHGDPGITALATAGSSSTGAL